jgi:hypothetical protein
MLSLLVMVVKMKRHVEFWDDERSYGNGIIITLKWGWSFENHYHEGVRGFDTPKETKEALKNIYPCNCKECKGK